MDKSRRTNHEKEKQIILSKEQIESFDIKMRDIDSILSVARHNGLNEYSEVLDIGGGNGMLCDRLIEKNLCRKAVMMDISDEMIMANKIHNKKEVRRGDILDKEHANSNKEKYDIIFVNMIMHHLVAERSRESRALVDSACRNIKLMGKKKSIVLLYEQTYERKYKRIFSPGRIIYYLTRIRNPMVAGLMKRLGANTSSVGVRFREVTEWIKIFEEQGFEFVDESGMIHKDNFGWLKMVLLNINEVGSRCVVFKT